METISHDNYETWFIDYLDGQLSGDRIDQLLDFLGENPDLKEELEKVASTSLIPTPEVYADKSSLKYSSDDLPGVPVSDFLCIASLEGDLNPEDQDRFERDLTSDPKLAAKFSAYRFIRLKPDLDVRFPDRSTLKRKTRILMPWLITAVSAAAVVVMVLLLWPGPEKSNGPVIAAIENLPVPSGKNDSGPPIEANTADQMPVVVAEASQPENDGTRIQKLPLKNQSDLNQGIAERERIRMEPLTQKLLHPGTFIPNPVSQPVLYAAKFSIDNFDKPDTDYLTLPQYALKFFREKVLGQDPKMVKETRFTLWEVADAGLDKVTTLVGSGMDLNRHYGETGDLLAVSFNSRLVDVEAPLRRKE